MKYVKKPEIVDVYMVDEEDMPEWVKHEISNGKIYQREDGYFDIRNEGACSFSLKGDYLIRDVLGRVRAIKGNVFLAFYEEVKE